MKKFMLWLAACALMLPAQAQDSLRTESLKDIGIKFELPMAWSKAQVQENKTSTIYTYSRKTSEQKKSSKATLSVLVEHIKPSTSIREYSMAGLRFFQKQNGFKINKTFVDTDGRFSLPYTIGYDAEYVDGAGQKHHLYIIHTIEFNHGAQFMIDFPAAEYVLYEEEQSLIMRSLRYER